MWNVWVATLTMNTEEKGSRFCCQVLLTRCGQTVVAPSPPEGRSSRRENLQVVHNWQNTSSVNLFTCHSGQIKRSYLCSGDLWLLKQSTVKMIFLIYAGSQPYPPQATWSDLPQYKRHKFRVVWFIQRLDWLVQCEGALNSSFPWRSSVCLHCYDVVIFFPKSCNEFSGVFCIPPHAVNVTVLLRKKNSGGGGKPFFSCTSNDKLSSKPPEKWCLLTVICVWEFLDVENLLRTHRGYLKMKPT